MTRLSARGPVFIAVTVGLVTGLFAGSPVAGLVIVVHTDRPLYGPGDVVRITIMVRNAGWRSVPVTFASSCETVFAIHRAGGAPVYRSAFHHGCREVLTTVTIAPGGGRTYAWVWDRGSDSGTRFPGPAHLFVTGEFGWLRGHAVLIVL